MTIFRFTPRKSHYYIVFGDTVLLYFLSLLNNSIWSRFKNHFGLMVTGYTYSYNSYTLRLKAVLHTLICKYELGLCIDRFAVLSKFKIRKWLFNVESPIQCRELHKDVYPDLNLLCKLMTIQNRLTVLHLKIWHLKNCHSIFSVRFMVRKVGLVNSTSKKFLNRGPYQDQEKS